MDDLTEREKELDCLYQISHLLVEFQGEELRLLEKAVLLLEAAMTHPADCEVDFALITEPAYAGSGSQAGKFSVSHNINNRETLILSVSFLHPDGKIQAREESLFRSAVELLAQSINRMRLEEKILAKNHALGEIIEQLSEDRHKRSRDMEAALYSRIFPALESLRPSLSPAAEGSLEIVKNEIRETLGLRSPLVPAVFASLSPREREIGFLIQSGMDTKTIAAYLHISSETVERHRCTIRKKAGLTGTGQSLYLYLIKPE